MCTRMPVLDQMQGCFAGEDNRLTAVPAALQAGIEHLQIITGAAPPLVMTAGIVMTGEIYRHVHTGDDRFT